MTTQSETVAAQTYDEIDAFFALYPGFIYRRHQPIHSELFRMFDTLDWHDEDPRRDEAWGQLRIAVIQAFNSAFGSDAEDLSSWQRICRCLEITPIPHRLPDAREVGLRSSFGGAISDNIAQAVSSSHINLVDLLQCVRTGSRVQRFATLDDLRDYTVHTRQYFPKNEAYEGGLLRYLLREIHNEYQGRRGKQIRKKGKARGSSKT